MSITINNGTKNKKIKTLAINNGSRNVNVKQIYLNNGERYKMIYTNKPRVLSAMKITLVGGDREDFTIDLTPLNGITTPIDWGDGTINNSLKHHYSNSDKATFYIKANFDDVKTIGENFLSHHVTYTKSQEITDIDLRVFKNVEEIGDWFLQYQTIKRINFKDMPKLKTIGCYCLKDCNSLESVDIYNHNSIETIGASFCLSCGKLESVVINHNDKLEAIGHYFLVETGHSLATETLSTCEIIGNNNLKSISLDITNSRIKQVHILNNGITEIRQKFMNTPYIESLRIDQPTPILASWGTTPEHPQFDIIIKREYYNDYATADVWKDKAEWMHPYD